MDRIDEDIFREKMTCYYFYIRLTCYYLGKGTFTSALKGVLNFPLLNYQRCSFYLLGKHEIGKQGGASQLIGPIHSWIAFKYILLPS